MQSEWQRLRELGDMKGKRERWEEEGKAAPRVTTEESRLAVRSRCHNQHSFPRCNLSRRSICTNPRRERREGGRGEEVRLISLLCYILHHRHTVYGMRYDVRAPNEPKLNEGRGVRGGRGEKNAKKAFCCQDRKLKLYDSCKCIQGREISYLHLEVGKGDSNEDRTSTRIQNTMRVYDLFTN